MTHDQIEQPAQPTPQPANRIEILLPKLRAFFTTLPEVRLAYYQPAARQEQLSLTGPDTGPHHPRLHTECLERTY